MSKKINKIFYNHEILCFMNILWMDIHLFFKSVKTREEDLEKQDQTSYMNHYSTVTIWNPRLQCYCSRNDLSCLLGYIDIGFG